MLSTVFRRIRHVIAEINGAMRVYVYIRLMVPPHLWGLKDK